MHVAEVSQRRGECAGTVAMQVEPATSSSGVPTSGRRMPVSLVEWSDIITRALLPTRSLCAFLTTQSSNGIGSAEEARRMRREWVSGYGRASIRMHCHLKRTTCPCSAASSAPESAANRRQARASAAPPPIAAGPSSPSRGQAPPTGPRSRRRPIRRPGPRR